MSGFSPFQGPFLDASGALLAGGKLYTYVAGSSTLQATYKDSALTTAHTNPIILDSEGKPPAPIWFLGQTTYKMNLTDSSDVQQTGWPIDNVIGIEAVTTVLQNEWVSLALTPTFISTTQFSVVGDVTTTMEVNRRIKVTISSGTKYGKITAASFGSGITTITVALDSGSLDSGLSAVWYGIISVTNDSVNKYAVGLDNVDNTSDANKPISTATQAALDASTTATQAALDAKATMAAGTKTSFFQASAPIGWTQDTSNNDAMLRVVSGSGGGTGGTHGASLGVPASTTGGHSLTSAENGPHTHTVAVGVSSTTGGGATGATYASIGPTTSSSSGSGTAHTHALTPWVPKFIDMIICSRD